ncbi:MAG: hypothetical protein ACE5HR_00300 [bacterium]
MSKPKEKTTKDRAEIRTTEEHIAWIRENIGNVIASNRVAPCEVISSGSIILDRILGVGGFPLGSIIEIWGEKGASKSTIGINTAVETQRKKQNVLFIDAECSFDNGYAHNLGIDFDRLVLIQSDDEGNLYAENIMKLIEKTILDSDIKLIILDSLPALLPRKFLEDGMLNYDSGGRLAAIAGLVTKALPRFAQIIKPRNKILIIINQVRANWGAGLNSYAPPYTRPCGEALEHYNRILLQLSPSDAIKKSEKKIGHWVTATINKSKVAPPDKGKFPLIYGEGIDTILEVATLGKALNLFEDKEGKRFYKDNIIGRTIEGMRAFFINNPTILEELIMEIENG